MKNYQDLLARGGSEFERGTFCKEAVMEFLGTPEYRRAKDGDAYYHSHNLTIEHYKKMLTTLSGRQIEDIFSSNYKLQTQFFRRLVTQQVQYVLGNGVTLQEEGNKAKLGRNFDYKLQEIAKIAMAQGKAFGFWNYDHLEVFGYADTDNTTGFCPLYDSYTSELRAGIRYWFTKLGDEKVFCCTLYEEDGLTDYRQIDDNAVELINSKKAYKQKVVKTISGDVESVIEENYSSLPIIPLYANDSRQSELVGIRESIDCYDFVKSGLANDIDDTSGFYWVLKNTGGMEDADLAQFVQRMHTVKATVLDGDAGADAEAHTIDVPVQARQTMLELLRKDIYEDFQALDVNTLSASAKTTQEIQASYQAQDNKCADFEYYLLNFVQKVLELAEINDEPTFKWNKVVNQSEQTTMVLMCANYLPADVIIKHLPFLTPEEIDDVIKENDNTDYSTSFGGLEEPEE